MTASVIAEKSFSFTGVLWLVAGATLFLSFSYTEMQGSDLWWHLAAGREILQTGSLWLVDDWSFTALGDVWRNHEWLADIIYYAWASVGGEASLVYWKWSVVILTFTCLQLVLKRECNSDAASLVCAGIALAVAAPFIDVRPHLYTLLLFSALLLMLLNRKAVIWQLVLLFVLWANLHGGFFFGLMALGILLLPWRNPSLKEVKLAAMIGFACVLACLVNPSGLNSLIFPLTYAFDLSSPYRDLGEWHSPFRSGGIQSPYFFWILAAAPIVALAYLLPPVRRKIDIPWEGIVLSALTVAMAITSRRFIPLFAISFAVMSAPLLGLLLHSANKRGVGIVLGLLALGVALVRMLPYPLAAGPAYHYLTAEYTYPVDTIDFMQANDIRANVYALYNWGGYIHWRTDGDLKVFLDGRANTVFGDQTYVDYIAVLTGRPGWRAKLEQSKADYFLWPVMGYGGGDKARELLDTGRWKIVYQDAVSFLLARTAVADQGSYGPGPATVYRELGLAQIYYFKGEYDRAIEGASKMRVEIPYQKSACNLLFDSYQAVGDIELAFEVSRECRSYFPSNHLRR